MAKEFFEFVALSSFRRPRPVELGVQKYGSSGVLTTGTLLLPYYLASFGRVGTRGLVSSQPVSEPANFRKNSRLRVFFEEKGEIGAVAAVAAGFILIEKLA